MARYKGRIGRILVSFVTVIVICSVKTQSWSLQIKQPSSNSSVLLFFFSFLFFFRVIKVSNCVPCLILCAISKHGTANNRISQSHEVLLDRLVHCSCTVISVQRKFFNTIIFVTFVFFQYFFFLFF